MSQPYERACIVGVGLLGASLGLALKQRGLARQVTGVGHRQASLDVALERGAIDTAFLDAAEGARDADLVVLATPASLVIPMMDAVGPVCPDAVVTDVASTKAAICAHADATWPAPRRFIGSHPMAGSEKFGAEHGTPDLYAGSVCLVETGDGLDPAARAAVAALWTAVGAEAVDVAPEAHDAMLACTSHLPHIVAAAVARVADRRGDVRKLVGNGYRDTTRIAEGRPEIWRDICLTNREAILAGLDELRALLESEFTAALRAGDGAGLERFFEEGRDARQRAVGKEGGA